MQAQTVRARRWSASNLSSHHADRTLQRIALVVVSLAIGCSSDVSAGTSSTSSALRSRDRAPVGPPVGRPTEDGLNASWDLAGHGDFGDVAVASWAAGRIDVFARRHQHNGQDALVHRWWTKDGGFQPSDHGEWEYVGDPIFSDPVAVGWDGHGLDVFARGRDHHLVHYELLGDATWKFEDLHGAMDGKPAVAFAGNRLDVFAVALGSTGALFHRGWVGFRDMWSEWEDAHMQIAGDPVAASWGPGNVDLFYDSDGDRQIMWNRWDGYASDGGLLSPSLAAVGNSGWTGWSPLGMNSRTLPAVASRDAGKLDVFATSMIPQVLELDRASMTDGAHFGPPAVVAPCIAGAPAAVSPSSDRIDLFVHRPTDNALLHNTEQAMGAAGGGEPLSCCGELEQPVCPLANPTWPGRGCNHGFGANNLTQLCEPCGGSGQVCCNYDRVACNYGDASRGSQACARVLGLDYCDWCGKAGQNACAGDVPCQGYTAVLDPATGKCAACGGSGQPACPWFTNWQRVGDLKVPTYNQVASIASIPNWIDLFTVGVEGLIYTTFRHSYALNDAGTWSTWAPLDGKLFPDHTPIAVQMRGHGDQVAIVEGGTLQGDLMESYNLDVFAVDGSGSIVWNTIDDRKSETKWEGWTVVGSPPGVAFSIGTPLSVISRGANQIEVYGVASDGHVWEVWRNFANPQSWSWVSVSPAQWFPVATPIAAIPRGYANTDFPEVSPHVDLLLSDSGGNLVNAWWHADGGGWRPFSPLPNPSAIVMAWKGSLSVVKQSPGMVDVFGIANDGRLVGASWVGSEYPSYKCSSECKGVLPCSTDCQWSNLQPVPTSVPLLAGAPLVALTSSRLNPAIAIFTVATTNSMSTIDWHGWGRSWEDSRIWGVSLLSNSPVSAVVAEYNYAYNFLPWYAAYVVAADGYVYETRKR